MPVPNIARAAAGSICAQLSAYQRAADRIFAVIFFMPTTLPGLSEVRHRPDRGRP